MNKFCIKCGSELSENSEFCPKCGRKVENSNSSAGNKNFLPFIIGGIIAVVFILVLVIVLVLVFLGNNTKSLVSENSPESVSLDFCNAFYKGNVDRTVELILPEYYDALDYDDKESLKESIEEIGETSRDYNITFTCKYIEKEKIIGDELDDLKEELLDDYGVDILEAYNVAMRLTTDENDESMAQNGTFVVVKSGSRYYAYKW